ncbi:SDR family oxidoreductase [Sorangium sp. So ce134]
MTVIAGRPLHKRRALGHDPPAMKNDTSTTQSKNLKIVVIGGTGLIGAKLVANLSQQGHDAVAASPSRGINSITGEGLAEALAGAHVVVDVTNAPSFEDKAVLEFFQTSTQNLLAAEAAAGVGHHVALSIVGIERSPESGYFRAKLAQEALIKASPVPYTIVRATQFFEFVGGIANSATVGQTVRLPSALMQPILSSDVAAVLAEAAVAPPLNGTVDLAGPDLIPMDELVRMFLKAQDDPRTVITDGDATYFGAPLEERSLVPTGKSPLTGPTRFEDWLRRAAPAR